jgi:hypothetical protein
MGIRKLERAVSMLGEGSPDHGSAVGSFQAAPLALHIASSSSSTGLQLLREQDKKK